MRSPHLFRYNSPALRGNTGNSTDGPSGYFRMRPPGKCLHTPHTFRGPIGSSSERGAYNDGTRNCTWLGPSPG
eukprot:7187637-Pyramimonas_sp.AAC.1